MTKLEQEILDTQQKMSDIQREITEYFDKVQKELSETIQPMMSHMDELREEYKKYERLLKKLQDIQAEDKKEP